MINYNLKYYNINLFRYNRSFTGKGHGKEDENIKMKENSNSKEVDEEIEAGLQLLEIQSLLDRYEQQK